MYCIGFTNNTSCDILKNSVAFKMLKIIIKPNIRVKYVNEKCDKCHGKGTIITKVGLATYIDTCSCQEQK